MYRIRNLLAGAAASDYDDTYQDHQQSHNNRNNTQQQQSSSWGARYGYGNNNNSNNTNNNNSRYNDDLYMSDDDDWGMSTLRESDRYGSGWGGGHGEQRRSSAFWDQSSTTGNNNNPNDGYSQPTRRGGTSSSGREMEMSSSSRNNNALVARGVGSLQEWEREAIMRDSLENAFEIGNDDYYHSDTQSPPPVVSGNNTSNNNAYDEVQEGLEEIDNGSSSAGDSSSFVNSANNGSSQKTKGKEEVVNAYRDYLKSIRDGGFESYLDTDANEELTPDFRKESSGGGGGEMNEDDALERTLDIEEERASAGSLYGNLYGVHDMRGSATMGGTLSSSPYEAWRAKAKALLQQEEERETTMSPSRAVLDKFRRKRSRDGVVTESTGGVGTLGTSNTSRSVASGGPGGVMYDHSLGGLRLEMSEKRMYTYRPPICLSKRFRGVCISICLILSLAAGLSYYGGKSSSGKEENSGEDVLTIPPKQNGAAETGASQQQNQNDQGKLNPNLVPSDAIKNALGTFDPIWYNRLSGWEGITFTDAVDFCSTMDNRVPCPYEIYCNQGKDGVPFMGDRPNGEQWSPVSNGANQWVSVGSGMFECHRYTDLHDNKKPDWGITGISTEHDHGAGGITQNVLCCVDVYNLGQLDPFTQWAKRMGEQEDIQQVAGDHTEETTNMAIVNVQDSANEKAAPMDGKVVSSSVAITGDLDSQKREKAVIAAFQPIWFSSAHGWSGTSYEDGILFCESYNHMVLCPYAAYCPNGQHKPAIPGSMITELDGEEWVPANGPMNTWVQIGTVGGDESTRCTLHHDLLGKRPEWGIDGTRSEVKHHIMCCLM